jgi:hypothetical protein
VGQVFRAALSALAAALTLCAPAQADALSLEARVWDHLYDGGKEVVESDCYDGPDRATTCTARFNTRRQGCERTFGERPFRPLTDRVCHRRQWEPWAITYDDFIKGIEESVPFG